jgi:hypothetical protein
MYYVDRCVVCESKSFVRYPAVSSPFISQIVQWRQPLRCTLDECTSCGHRFYDLRLDDSEMARLYANYRGKAYFALRHSWEPWYTATVNDSIGHDRREIDSRRAYVLDFLRKSLPPAVFAGEVLDYGGDKGQFMPPELGKHKYVFEVSDQEPIEGVVHLTERRALRRHFDLVMLCHVLEHLSNPIKFLSELRDQLGPATGEQWTYAEVPLERPRLLKRPIAGPARRGEAAWITRSRRLWLFLDLCSTLSRKKLDTVPPFGIIKLHEHLNFFSSRSLRTLFERAGFSVHACEEGSVVSSSGIGAVVKLLARRGS